MSAQPPPDQNIIDARRHQDTFELYVLGLTFTILGLSVQTASFGVALLADSAELLGWVSLLISGLFGLHRGLWKPNLYNVMGMKSTFQVESDDADKMIKYLTEKLGRSHAIQKHSFVLGLMALMIARGYQPVAVIFKAIKSSCN